MQPKEEESPDLSFLTSASSQPDPPPIIDKFQAIQDKLERYSRTRTINREHEMHERLNVRIAEMERRLAEEARQAEERIYAWRELLSEMRVQSQQQEKRQGTLIQQRAQQLKQLKAAINAATQKQEQDHVKSQHQIVEKFSSCFGELGKALERESSDKITQVNSMEAKFGVNLPSLSERIATLNNYFQSLIVRTQKQALQESDSFQQLLQQRRSEQEKSGRKTMQLILHTIQQIQSDMERERKQRQAMQEKLHFLVLKASRGIHQ